LSNAVVHADKVIERAARYMSLMGGRWYRKYGGPAPAAGEPLLPGRGRGRIVALSRVNAVFADDIGQLGQKRPKPGILLDQRMSFVGLFVATKGGLVPAQGILKQ
jgi:hypothetical protein